MSEKTSKLVNLYIVVADENLDDHELVKSALNDCDLNHIVTSVYNGEQLMDLLHRRGFYNTQISHLPDMIILDVKIPLIGGLDVLEQIKSNDRFKNIPVYILSSAKTQSDAEKAVALGAVDYFVKPHGYADLANLIKKICTDGPDCATQ